MVADDKCDNDTTTTTKTKTMTTTTTTTTKTMTTTMTTARRTVSWTTTDNEARCVKNNSGDLSMRLQLRFCRGQWGAKLPDVRSGLGAKYARCPRQPLYCSAANKSTSQPWSSKVEHLLPNGLSSSQGT